MNLDVRVLISAREYIDSLPLSEQGFIRADLEAMKSGDFQALYTKQLKGIVRELIIKHHRLSYFQIGSTLYVVRGFRKKSAKTPKAEIEYAEKVYKKLKEMP